LSKDKQVKVEAVPQAVREIAWKAQSRLNRRYRALLRRGKLKNIAITAVAREFVGFIWAVAQGGRRGPGSGCGQQQGPDCGQLTKIGLAMGVY
jgi:hypothetical protein